jgi:hypothetical protein
MALLTDPDDLNQSTEVTINTGTRQIQLNEAGNLSDDGVTLQALYSFLKEEWRTDANLIPFPFPMVAITPEQFEFVEDWEPFDDATRKLIRTAGWRENDESAVTKREYIGIISLGNIDFTDKNTGDRAYYAFSTDTAKTDFTYAGPVNEAIQTYGDADNGNFDKRSDVLTLFIRVQGKTYDQATTVDIGVPEGSTLSYIVYRFPLAEGADLNITDSDAVIESANTPGQKYGNVNITYYETPQDSATIFGAGNDLTGGPWNFGVVIDATNGTGGPNLIAEDLYTWVQYQLRQETDIDFSANANAQIGVLQDQLLRFVGSDLETLSVTNTDGGGSGVAIVNYNGNDTNRISFTDNTGGVRTFPFVAAGTLEFNSNLVSDGGPAKYFMFFEYTVRTVVSDLVIGTPTGQDADFTSAGNNLPTLAPGDYFSLSGAVADANNGIWEVNSYTSSALMNASRVDDVAPVAATSFSGTIDENPINSPDALLVQDNSGIDITGDIVSASQAFDFDYDGNSQGGRTPGTDAPIVIRAIGLGTAQFVEATGTITQATGLTFTLVSALERNYLNP